MGRRTPMMSIRRDSSSESSGSEESSSEESSLDQMSDVSTVKKTEKSESSSESESSETSDHSAPPPSIDRVKPEPESSNEESSSDETSDQSSKEENKTVKAQKAVKKDTASKQKTPPTKKESNIVKQKEESMKDISEEESEEESDESEMSIDPPAASSSDHSSSSKNSPSDEETETESEEEEETLPNVPITFEYKQQISTANNPPHILNFPKAPLPPACLEATQNPNAQDRSTQLKLKVLRAKDEKRHYHRVVLGDTNRMEYVGKNFGSSASHTVNHYAIGIFDREKRKIRIISTPDIISMEQRIKSFDESELEENDESSQGKRKLVEEFGSKRSRSLLNTSIRNRVSAEDNIDQATLESMSNSLKEKASNTMSLDNIKQGIRSDLPPYDQMADDRSQIYQFEKIIPKDIRKAIIEAAQPILTKSQADLQEEILISNEYPQSVLDHFDGLSKASDREEFASGIMYMVYLIKFYKQWNGRLSRVGDMSKAMNIPVTIIPHLLNTFSAKQVISEKRTRYVRNSNHKVKLINYIFVSHLILSNFAMGLNQLMRDLMLDLKTVRMHALKIGCTVVGGAKTFRGRNSYDNTRDQDINSIQEMTATLSCPIQFFESSGRSKKFR